LLGQTTIQIDTAGTMPGAAALRIGRSFAGENWDINGEGLIRSVSLAPALSESEFYSAAATYLLMAM
jgi:hypothetical protein